MASALPTIQRLAEQTALLITGGSMINDYNNVLTRAKHHVVSQINHFLKVEQMELRTLNENVASIDTVIANYELDTSAGTAKGSKTILKLPIRPISLPHGQGIWSVFMEDDNGKEGEFLYLPPGMRRNFLATYPIFDTKRRYGKSVSKTFWGWYSQHSGTEIILNGDYTGVSNIVHLQLLVVDISQIQDDDVLPVPADMVNAVIMAAYEQLRLEKPFKDLVVDQSPNTTE